MEDVIGGIGEIGGSTMVLGGGERVVGGVAKSAARDRLLHLKHAPDDEKDLLAIIDMSRPVVFGNLNWDDGSSGFVIKKKSARSVPAEALEARLKERLAMPAAEVVSILVKEYRLNEPAWRALVDIIADVAAWLEARPARFERLKICGDIGRLLDEVENGDKYFEIATHGEHAPSTAADVLGELLDRMPAECEIAMPAALSNTSFPSEPPLPAASVAEGASVRDYVQAIVLREHQLMDYLDAVEQYYIAAARDIQQYGAAFAGCKK